MLLRPLIFCPFRSPSLCFCSLPRAQRPVLHDFRSSDQELTLQQPRCAIRGQFRDCVNNVLKASFLEKSSSTPQRQGQLILSGRTVTFPSALAP